MSRPLLISDCDEVLLHMVVPFRDWLGEAHGVHFELEGNDFSYALTRKADGSQVEPDEVWQYLGGFFDTEMHRQLPISGAIKAVTALAEIADVVILTNLQDHRAEARAEQLRAVGIDFPVFTNQGGKGAMLKRVLDQYEPSVAVFVDDIAHNHISVAEYVPDIWRLHFIGEPLLARHLPPCAAAHARIDHWSGAEGWIRDKFLGGVAAPILKKEKS